MDRYYRGRPCPKCGSHDNKDTWIEETNTLLRECKCGYKWEEYALDDKEYKRMV